ncbi:adenosylcobinamide-GDP ribazoletransferase, partial [uncultured Flavonifractor sp.]|uniref:adenosylcobinamide-GDP ribazoletransferase n=1 Tax=uncultured Flavonifractor sp. TaxID=1193534 RepID=UPI00266F4F2D
DGFCDTCDALSSHQSRERKLEILKDSHTGAFAIICCGLYLLVFFACWSEVAAAGRAALVLALGPVLSRSLSGLFAVTLPNARGTGLLATFTGPMDTAKARGVMVIWVVACVAAMLWLDLWTGGAALLGAGLACLYYRVMSARQFGGVTGDLAGFFLQICELGMVLMVAVVQKIEVLV